MKIINKIKFTGLIALVLSTAIGCAAAPTQEPEAAAACTPAEAQAAIDAAQAAIDEAAAQGALWRDTQEILDQARDALANGECERALELAGQARRQAEDAVQQKAREAEQMQQAGADRYVVGRGDSLWRISGKEEVYGNPYQWPLIFKANRDQIRDADLIYPGQELRIERNVSAGDIDAAVQHARTRGAWSLGVMEDSDRAYLAQ